MGNFTLSNPFPVIADFKEEVPSVFFQADVDSRCFGFEIPVPAIPERQ